MSNRVKADPFAVAALADAVERYGAGITLTIDEARRAATAARVHAIDVVSRSHSVVRRLEREIANSNAAPEEDGQPVARRALNDQHSTALRHLADAQRALRLIDDAASGFSSTGRTVTAVVNQHVADGATAARRYAEALGVYLQTDIGDRGSSIRTAGTAAGAGADLPNNFSLVALDEIDDSDSELRAFEKVNRSDVEWGIEQLERVVVPAVQRGKGADYFASRDATEGLTGDRSYTAVHRAFFNEHQAIKLSRRADGKLDVSNGYHRLRVARELGLARLPAIVCTD